MAAKIVRVNHKYMPQQENTSGSFGDSTLLELGAMVTLLEVQQDQMDATLTSVDTTLDRTRETLQQLNTTLQLLDDTFNNL